MKHFINLKDISALDLRKIIDDAKKRKNKRKRLSTLDTDKDNPLKGKLLIQMFEKSSLRTRLSFFLAIKQLGGGALTLRPDELHLGKGAESIEDTAKILSTYGNGFMLRSDSDEKIIKFSKHLTIPIINGLSPSSHPTQVLSDIFTVEEIKKKPISKLNICWIGDSNNVLNSLIAASVKFSFNLSVGCPKNYEPKKIIIDWVKNNKKKINIFLLFFLTQSLTFLPGSNFLGHPMLNLNENLTEAAIKLSKTLLESPIQHIFNFEIGFFFISSTVNTSDNTWVGCEDGLKPFIIGIVE